jgi:hypothetical protein
VNQLIARERERERLFTHGWAPLLTHKTHQATSRPSIPSVSSACGGSTTNRDEINNRKEEEEDTHTNIQQELKDFLCVCVCLCGVVCLFIFQTGFPLISFSSFFLSCVERTRLACGVCVCVSYTPAVFTSFRLCAGPRCAIDHK